MKEKIGFICIGQAGGNIGYLFEQCGYNCLYINTSKEDLDTLNTKYRYHMPEGQGCNHSREKAIYFTKKYYKNIMDEVLNIFFHQDLIYLIFSSGGGTGSGSSPLLLEMLNSTFPQKYFGCITILPSLSEPVKVQINAYECYKQITNIERLASVFTLDNDKLDKFMINKHFVNIFNSIIDIPKHINIKGNIDKAEIWEQLVTRGNMIISAIDKNNNNLTVQIIKSWENNIFAELEKDKNIMYLGLSLYDDINLNELMTVVGTPYDIFKNYNNNQTVTILSGLSFPKVRLNKILNVINNNKEKVRNNILNSKTDKITEDISFFEDILKVDNFNIDDLENILAKY